VKRDKLGDPESIAILIVDKTKARLTRFSLELRGEVNWAGTPSNLAETISRLRPDLVNIVEDTESADRLAQELRERGLARSVFLITPARGTGHPSHQAGIALPEPVDPLQPKRLVAGLVEALREAQTRAPLSPLTQLPGSLALQREVERRLAANEVFDFLYLDLDNFKAYNDLYGFARGDLAIQLLARHVVTAVQPRRGAEDLCVHIGGDDFGVLTTPDRSEVIGHSIISGFEADSPSLYSEEDRARGYIVTADRRGREARWPLMTVSIACDGNERRVVTSYLQLSDIAAEVKIFAKSVPGSVFLRDRRANDQTAGEA